MKDYYYILGIKQTASTEEIKKAYRKLSMKFHPDKNDGDEFFTDRFKEIQEAYEILIEPIKRSNYDKSKNNNTQTNQTYHNNHTNFTPEIEYFKADKNSFEFDEEVTFSWKTINSNKVILKPFGIVEAIGSKKLKIKDFKKHELTFELTAENTTINRLKNSKITLKNRTYNDLYNHFAEKIKQESEKKSTNQNQTNYTTTNTEIKEEYYDSSFWRMIWFNVIIIIGIILFVITR